MVRVVAHQRWEIESRRKPGLAVRKQITKALVGVFGGAEPRELAHGPQASTMHGGVNAAGVGRLTGLRKLCCGIPALEIGCCVKSANRMPGNGGEFSLPLGILGWSGRECRGVRFFGDGHSGGSGPAFCNGRKHSITISYASRKNWDEQPALSSDVR